MMNIEDLMDRTSRMNATSPKALVQHKVRKAIADLKRAHTLMQKAEATLLWAERHDPQPVLWAFNFVGGGFNDVRARTQEEAIALARAKFESPETNCKVDPATFRPLRSRREEQAYHNNQPLMD